MNKELLNLQRDIIEGAPKDKPPYDRYCYNSFSHAAQYLSHRVKTEEERELCIFLRDMAIRKSRALLAQEQEALHGRG